MTRRDLKPGNITLADIAALYRRYVPRVARHPNVGFGPKWWPAHELGHLLTTPRAAHELPMFGLDDDTDPDALNVHERRCRELAAMHVSGSLLRAAGRADVADQEREDTAYDTMKYAEEPQAWRRVRAILRLHRVTRLPRTRAGLEAVLRRATNP